MTLNNPILEKVFLSLRPNFFPDYHKEHITLRYYNRVRWDVLLEDSARLEKHLPATISPLIYSSWTAWNKKHGLKYNGLLVECKGSEILDHLEMPHITLPTERFREGTLPLLPNLEPQIVDTLWVGKSIKGQYIWAKYNTKQIKETYEQLAEFPHADERIPPLYEPTSLAGG